MMVLEKGQRVRFKGGQSPPGVAEGTEMEIELVGWGGESVVLRIEGRPSFWAKVENLELVSSDHQS